MKPKIDKTTELNKKQYLHWYKEMHRWGDKFADSGNTADQHNVREAIHYSDKYKRLLEKAGVKVTEKDGIIYFDGRRG